MMTRFSLIRPFIVISSMIFLLAGCNSVQTDSNLFGDAAADLKKIAGANPTYGWKFSSMEEHNLDPHRINEADKYLTNTPSGFRSLLIVKDTNIVYEKYYNGWDANKPNNVKSVTKSVTSSLIGILESKDIIKNINEPIGDIFPEYFSSEKDKKRAITLKHLLTMTTGLAWNNNSDSGSHKGSWWESTEPDKFALSVSPLMREPGSTFHYNSSNSHMLSSIVKKKSGMQVLDFANENLFRPLGITNVRWDADNAGTQRGNSELFLTTRDMAKLGLLYLNRGNWFGEQIIKREWISDSFTKHAYDQYDNEYYGYQWWIKEIAGKNVFFANGYGGQYIYVIPSANMVVVTTCRWDNTSSSKIPNDIMEKYIIPAVN